MRTFAGTLLVAFLIALATTPIIIWFARRRKKGMDHPDPRKIHSADVPRIGGIAIIIATLGATIAVMLLRNVIGAAFRKDLTRIAAMLAAASLIATVGLLDDIRGLRARFKFLAQALAATALCALGIRIDAVPLPGLFTLHLAWLAWPLTILWIVGITNAVNLIDGLDGLAAGICAVACAVTGIFALLTNQNIMATLMAALLGSLLGFLRYNFNPARIFMGDCGTYFLGFTLATASVLCATKASTIVGLALPALALGVPIFDTLLSIVRRFLERRSIFSPDRGHIHHRLYDMGLRQRHVVILLYLATALAAALGMFMLLTRDARQIIIFASILILIALVFRLAGCATLHDTIAAIRRRLATDRALHHTRRIFEDAQLRLRLAADFNQWWTALCTAAENMQLASLTLTLTDPDHPAHTLTWTHPDPQHNGGASLKATVPVRDHRSGSTLEAHLEAPVNGSLELAGHTLAYFTRLLDEHSPAAPRHPMRQSNERS